MESFVEGQHHESRFKPSATARRHRRPPLTPCVGPASLPVLYAGSDEASAPASTRCSASAPLGEATHRDGHRLCSVLGGDRYLSADVIARSGFSRVVSVTRFSLWVSSSAGPARSDSAVQDGFCYAARVRGPGG